MFNVCTPVMSFEVVGRVGWRMILFVVWVGRPKQEWANFLEGGIGQHNITYRKHVALHVQCPQSEVFVDHCHEV